MRALALSFAAVLIGLTYCWVDRWWPLWSVLPLAVALSWAFERWLAPPAPELSRGLVGLRLGEPRAALLLTGKTTLVASVAIAIGFAAFVLVARSGQLSEEDVDAMPWDFRHPDQAWGQLWRACIVAPVVEELLWRGLIQRQLARATGTWPAIALSGVAFWIMHWIPWGAPTPINHVLGGWIIAWSWHRTGGLLAPILLHAVGNAATVATCLLWIARPGWLRDLLGFS